MPKLSKAKNALHNLGNRGRRMLRWIKGQHFPPGFDEWCELNYPYSGAVLDQAPTLHEWMNKVKGIPSQKVALDYINLITEEGKRWLALQLDVPESARNLKWDFQFPALGSNTDPISIDNTNVCGLYISGAFTVLNLCNLRVQKCSMQITNEQRVIRWVNCIIGNLELCSAGVLPPKWNLEFHDCWIGTFVLKSNCLRNLTMTGGGIAHIECPSSYDDSPFQGAVSFKKVYFPSSVDHTELFQGPHAYSSLYGHLNKLDNTLMANLMRSHQLRAQRVDEEGFAYVTNWIYDKFSDYGMSPGRPLWWLGVAYILAVIYCYNFDYGTLMSQYTDTYVGAYAALLDENGGRLTRSFLLPLHSIINPFGVFFDPRKLFVPTTGFGSILLTIQGLFSDILLVMTALSVRRRFKTE